MKKIALLTLSAVTLVGMVGCATPVYSAKERSRQIARNMDLEWKMLNDDVDNVLMINPMSTLSRWNIR